MPKKIILTPQMETYFKENRLTMSSTELGEKFNIGKGYVRKYLIKNNLQLTRKQSQKIASSKMRGRTNFTKKEDEYIISNYLNIPVKTMANQIGRSGYGVIVALKRLGLVIPKQLCEQRKEFGMYRKGHAPANKGKKQVDYMSPEAIEKTKATRFQKGQIPANAIGVENGDIVIRNMHNYKKSYKWIRVSLGIWEMLHVNNWEKINGPVPKGYILRFKDGDTMNCEPENLELIDRKTNMELNSIHRYPAHVKKSIRLIGKLKKEINNIQK